jgi:predicted lipoprotein with Yx(FWY)xxD motif
MRRFVPVLAALAALALLAGCGSSSSSSNDNAANTTPANPYGGNATSSTTPAASTSDDGGDAETIKTAKAKPGTILVDGEGKAVYLFEMDKKGVSKCSDACAAAWPPVTTTGAPKATGGATSSMLGTLKRDDGTMQVTYNGHPLYYYAGDSTPGQTNGEGLTDYGAEWYVVGTKGDKMEGDKS